MLWACCKSRRSLDPDVRETKQSRNRCSRDCCRTHWSASTVVERVFRCVCRKSLFLVYSGILFVLTCWHQQYALVNFFMFYKSGHGIFRMFFLHIQALVRDISCYVDQAFWIICSITSSLSSSPGLLWQTYGSHSASSSTYYLLKVSLSSVQKKLWVFITRPCWLHLKDCTRRIGSIMLWNGSTCLSWRFNSSLP